MDTLPGRPSSLRNNRRAQLWLPTETGATKRQLPGKVIGSAGAVLLSPAGTCKGGAFLRGHALSHCGCTGVSCRQTHGCRVR